VISWWDSGTARIGLTLARWVIHRRSIAKQAFVVSSAPITFINPQPGQDYHSHEKPPLGLIAAGLLILG